MIRKAVIPAAGLGTRFLPATKSMPKEMFPIIDKPIIHYIVEEAIDAGLDDIIIITGRGKRAIEDYFDESPGLELELIRKHKRDLAQVVKYVSSLADITFIRQKEPRGLGDAILRAEKHIGGEPFAVLLGDDIIKSATPAIRQLMELHENLRCSVIAVEEVPREKIPDYGIIRHHPLNDRLFQVEDIVEKPSIAEAPSNMGAIGRYVFNPELFDCLKKTEPGIGNEIQLTDGIRLLKELQDVYAYRIEGKRYDTGDVTGYIRAIIELGLDDENVRADILKHLHLVYERESP